MEIHRHTVARKALFIAFAIFVLNFGVPYSNIFAEGQPTEEVDAVEGPHGGRLLGAREFQAEVTIYEPDIPPQSRVYFYENGRPLDPSLVQLSIELHRIDRVDVFRYRKQDDYLIGDKIVEEPHSFDVKVKASYKGAVYEWEYSSHEGRTELSQEAVERAGILVEPAGPAKIQSRIQFNGRIVPNEYGLVRLTPRFPGLVRSMNKSLGDVVEKNDLLAVIESNESLSAYEVRSEIKGSVIQRNVSIGEVVSEGDTMFVVADFSTVWVDLNVYRQDISKIKKGQAVFIHGVTPEAETVEATITYISPISTGNTQTFLARAVLPNPDMTWRPGLYVKGDVVLEEKDVPIAVKASAIQTFRDWDVVFKQVNNVFEIAILELGLRDGEWVEVISGLEPNTKYVTENSFVVKADILKSGAGHDH